MASRNLEALRSANPVLLCVLCASVAKKLDFHPLSLRRQERARALALRYPASRQALEFCASLASFQDRIFPRTANREALPRLLPSVQEWMRKSGPHQMRQTALDLDEAAFAQALDDYWERRDTSSPISLLARGVLQPCAWAASLGALRQSSRQTGACPRCSHLPQAGVLRPQGHGRALTLCCSLCLQEWPFSRGRCPVCQEESAQRQPVYNAQELPHIQLHACDSCRRYLHWIDLSEDKEAVPDVDELAALPLDVWARQHGYRKVQINLAGI